jgi:hypothetical protein
MDMEDAFYAKTSKPYRVTLDGYVFPVVFWIGRQEIRTFTREHQSFLTETRRAHLHNKKNVPCTTLYINNDDFTLDSYYFIEGTFRPPCVKPPRDKMFALFDAFAVALGFNEIHVSDSSFVKLPMCDWDLSVLEKIRSGKSFYEKQGYVYQGEYPNLIGIDFNGMVREYAGGDTLKQVVERLHDDCTHHNHVKIGKRRVRTEKLKRDLKTQIEHFFHLHQHYVKPLHSSGALSINLV